jgi:hypothetical protein
MIDRKYIGNIFKNFIELKLNCETWLNWNSIGKHDWLQIQLLNDWLEIQFLINFIDLKFNCESTLLNCIPLLNLTDLDFNC